MRKVAQFLQIASRYAVPRLDAILERFRTRQFIRRLIREALTTKTAVLEVKKGNWTKEEIFKIYFRQGMSGLVSETYPQSEYPAFTKFVRDSRQSNEDKIYACAGVLLGVLENIYLREEASSENVCRNRLFYECLKQQKNVGVSREKGDEDSYLVSTDACLTFLLGIARLRDDIVRQSRLDINDTETTPLEKVLEEINSLYENLNSQQKRTLREFFLVILDQRLVQPALGNCYFDFLKSAFNIISTIYYLTKTDFRRQLKRRFCKLANQYARTKRSREKRKTLLRRRQRTAASKNVANGQTERRRNQRISF